MALGGPLTGGALAVGLGELGFGLGLGLFCGGAALAAFLGVGAGGGLGGAAGGGDGLVVDQCVGDELFFDGVFVFDFDGFGEGFDLVA